MTKSNQDTSDRAIAIIGLGSRFPGAPDLPSFWRTVQERQVHARPIPRSRWNHDLFYSERALKEPGKTYANRLALVDDIEHMAPDFFGITPRRARVMDPQQRLFLDAVRMALEDAGYAARPFPRERTGVFVGAAVSDFRDILVGHVKATLFADGIMGHGLLPAADVARALTRDLAPLQAYSLVGQALNMIAANVSQCFEFGGAAFTTDSACSSALVALHEATLHLRSGICDAAVVGGVHTILVPDGVVAFTRIGAISPSNVCRPFDRRADGFVMGEGAGAILLKRLPDALRDGDRIYAVIRGIAMNNDGRAEGPMTPSLQGQMTVLDRAYADAGVSPRTIDYIEAHGTATPVGDATEVTALFRVREEHNGATTRAERPCALTSVKANVGHCMTASGAAGLIRAALSLDRKRLTPHAGYSEVRPELELEARGFFIPEKEQDFAAPTGHPRRAGLNSFGFGGTNVHVVLEESPPPSAKPRAFVQVTRAHAQTRPHPRPELFVISAATDKLLAAYATDLATTVRGDPTLSVGDIAYTLAARRHDPVRAAFLAAERETLLAMLDALSKGEDIEGLMRSRGPVNGPPAVAFLFPGQGAQAPGLAHDIYLRIPGFRRTLDELCAAYTPDERPLLNYLYPAVPDAPDARTALTATEICQPIMAALGLAYARTLRELGVEPVAVMGHSLGEFSAAACAGLFSARTAVRLVGARGALIAGLSLPDRGAMAALACDRSRAEALVADLADVAIANINHPNQIVISGTTPALETALLRAEAQGIKTRRLEVSHAFHSPLMAGLRGRFEVILDNTPFGPVDIPLVSAILPGVYPSDADAARSILIRHATATVDFVSGLRTLGSLGARIFLQMGAGRALATMARHTLGVEHTEAMFLSAGGDTPDEGHTFLTTLGNLFVAGAPLRLLPLFEDEERKLVTLPATRLDTRALWPVKQSEVHAPLQVLIENTTPATTPTASPTPPSSHAMKQAPSSPSFAGLPGNQEDAVHPLRALFDRQLALINAQIEIMREQNRLLAGLGTTALPGTLTTEAVEPRDATTAPMSEPPPLKIEAPAPQPEATRKDDTDTVDRIMAELIAVTTRITASAPGRVLGKTRLVADLGFDSLMVAELITAMVDRYPGLELPRALFAEDISIERLAHEIAALVGAESAKPAAFGEPQPSAAPSVAAIKSNTGFERRPVVLAPRPLPDTALLPIAGPVRIIGAARLAAEICAGLRKRAAGPTPDIEVCALDTPDADIADALLGRFPAGTSIVDLRGLCVSHTAAHLVGVAPEKLRAPAQRVLRTLRALSRNRPARYMLFHGGGTEVAIEGLAKALGAEWPTTTVRTIELPGARGDDDPAVGLRVVADCIVREVAAADATTEIRYTRTGLNGSTRLTRFSPVLGDPLGQDAAHPERLRDAVVLMTGGAGGIGRQIARMLARHGARLALLGRSPPDANTETLVRELVTVGGLARYDQCDVTRLDEIKAALAHIRATLGPVRFVVHAAGLVEDTALENKDPASFTRVFDTKVAGALNLWQALASEPIEVFLALGSLAGRFGNAHQIDYASANNTLARLCEAFGQARPEVTSLVLDLPPWQGSGMIERLPEAARRLLANKTGILPAEDGTNAILATLLGAARGSSHRLASGELVLSRFVGTDELALCHTIRIDHNTLPYLDDHQIAGRRVLPLSGAVDLVRTLQAASAAAGENASALCLRDTTVIDGLVLTDSETSAVLSVRMRGAASGTRAFELVRHDAGAARTAFRGKVVPIEDVVPLAPPTAGHAPRLTVPAFYGEHTFHGSHLQAIIEVTDLGVEHIRGRVIARSVPGGSPLVSALDGGLQLLAFWATENLGRGGLPLAASEIHLRRLPEDGEQLQVLARFASGARARERTNLDADLDFSDAHGRLVLAVRGLRAELRDIGKKPAEPALALPPAHVYPEEFPELKDLEQRLALAKAAGISNPYFREYDGCNAATARVKGRELINFSSYNYLGLSGHPEVNEAVKAAVDRYGSSVSASRVASGQRPLHTELEAELADILGTEASLCMVGGHATNVSGIGHLLGAQDLLIHDALAHDSILGGARLSGARRRNFAHNDPAALEQVLRETRAGVRRVLIAVEGVYSMDGDIAPLPEFIALKKKYGAMLLVDEAHSIGVLGAHGRGVGEHYGVNPADVDLWMGTLSKSLASCGGYLAGSRRLVQYLRYTIPGFIYSVGLSPANAAAALAAARILRREPERARLLQDRAAYFLRLCKERNINTGLSRGSAVVPCIVGNSYLCLRLSQALEARGINVQPILYPAVEENQARLRFFISVTHSEEQLLKTADILAEELDALIPERHAASTKAAEPTHAPAGDPTF